MTIEIKKISKLIAYVLLYILLSGCVTPSLIVDGRGDKSYKEKLLYERIVNYEETDKDEKGRRKNIKIVNNEARYIDENGNLLPEESRITFETCNYWVYLGIFFLLDIWNMLEAGVTEVTIDSAIEKLQEKDPKVIGLRYITVDISYKSPLIFFVTCTEVKGFPIYASAD